MRLRPKLTGISSYPSTPEYAAPAGMARTCARAARRSPFRGRLGRCGGPESIQKAQRFPGGAFAHQAALREDALAASIPPTGASSPRRRRWISPAERSLASGPGTQPGSAVLGQAAATSRATAHHASIEPSTVHSWSRHIATSCIARCTASGQTARHGARSTRENSYSTAPSRSRMSCPKCRRSDDRVAFSQR